MINLIGNNLDQWETGRKIQVVNKDIVKLSFCNNHCCNPIEVDVVDGIVDIPNKLLQQSMDIDVYGINENGEEVYSCMFAVNSKYKPADYSEPVEEGGGSGGASSWNDLKDKPFGDETEELFRWNGSAEVEDGYINFYFPFDVSILTTGKEYLVTLNGTPYALEFNQVYMGIYRLQKTGIDFYIEFSSNKGSFYFTEDNFTGTTADLSISGLVRTYMPEEFLPDSVQLKPYIISVSYSVGNSYSVTDGNLDEAEKAHSIGREVYVYISNYGVYKVHTINRWSCSCIFIYVDDDSDDVKAVRLEIDESLNVTVRELTLSTL